jgi:hypothetical protein
MSATGVSRSQQMTPFFHLSIDDVFASLVTASARDRALAMDTMFGALDRLHAEFGMLVDLYLFAQSRLEGRQRGLDEVSTAVAADLRQRPWLRLGPHAVNPETPPHRQTAPELNTTLQSLFESIDRLVGPAARSSWVRLHEFSEAYEAAPMLKAHGVEALLTTDKPAVAWRLPHAERDTLRQAGRVSFNGIEFVRSHLRAELLVAEGIGRATLLGRVRNIINTHGFLAIFTHEICFSDPRTAAMLHDVLDACRELGLRSF